MLTIIPYINLFKFEIKDNLHTRLMCFVEGKKKEVFNILLTLFTSKITARLIPPIFMQFFSPITLVIHMVLLSNSYDLLIEF